MITKIARDEKLVGNEQKIMQDIIQEVPLSILEDLND